jgi:hypothetical protein
MALLVFHIREPYLWVFSMGLKAHLGFLTLAVRISKNP